MAEGLWRLRKEDDEQRLCKCLILDMLLDTYKVNILLGRHRHTAQQTTGYKRTLENKIQRRTGNRLVLILKVVEPYK